MEHNAQEFADRPAVIFEDQQISWKDLDKKADSLCGFFSAKLGLKKQQPVAILATNSIDFIIIYLAVLKSGHFVIPIDPAYKKLEIDSIIDLLEPAIIIIQKRYSAQLSRRQIPIHNIDELLDNSFPKTDSLRLTPRKQIASITFTSGTSGQPKAVPNTHANHIWNIKTCSLVWNWDSKDSLLLTLPLSHWYGLVMGLSGTIYHGNTLYLHQQSFATKDILEELASGKISIFTHAPIAYIKMLEQDDEYDLSKVRLFISGSAPFPPQLWNDFKDRFKVEVLETYGSSETGRIAANSPNNKRLGSPGKVLPKVQARINTDGEVEVKSGGLFPGYYHNSEATKKAITKDGFWRTGDLGEIQNGYVYLKGRVQERIRRFGYTISPRDVEWAMRKNPKIKDIYVMGIQQKEKSNDELIYFVVSEIGLDELQAYCKQNLLFAWRPDRVIYLDSMPLTRNGKPHFKRLKEMAA